ncbi:polysaccharide pyruvyl transferase family protein [Brevibacterium aurantiacum]|uniref:Polysaccharide pyruvyl transferase domain-containing protein n=1 Tax=Brevibacterium aurantiacum TaxID=273384 RepID=A0A2A3ZRZ2_BREAU|nr:polysaccharide pyruvyl transferase family protein [Brevibacterium aurantiacum]PCC54460.1 hypothetical protein CIK59_05415 [Brevibacterium aurantiacum]
MPDLKLFHFDIPTWGNYGDKALFPVVRDAFRVLGSGGAGGVGSTSGRAGGGMWQSGNEVDFTSAAALRREVDLALVERINSAADAVVIGGGGLFLQDTNPNRLSGWQWKISAEALAAIEVPLIIYALGDNRFPGQPEFDDLMRSHVSQVLDQSVFFGLRNTGSIETMSRFLGAGDLSGGGESSKFGESSSSRTDSIRFQPCPTTIAGLLYEPLIDRRPDPNQKVLAIQMLVHPRQQAAGYDAEVIHQATIDAARMLVAKDWSILSVPFHPDDAEVSRQLLAEVPEVEEVRLHGPDVGFFAGFDLFASIPYVLGGRGHAQMIPFGVGAIPISLDLHAKLGYFAEDIGHPEFVVPVAPEGMADENEIGSETARRAQILAQRIVDTVERAYAQGNDLQCELLSTRQDLFDLTRDNHAVIHDLLRPGSRPASTGSTAGQSSSPERLLTSVDIRAEEFHLAAVAEAEEFSAAQTRDLTKVRREHKKKLESAATHSKTLETERENLRAELKHKESQLERQSAQLDAQTTELDAQTAEKNRHADEAADLRKQLDETKAQLRSVNDRTATSEAKVLMDKTAHGLTWRARRIKRTFKR